MPGPAEEAARPRGRDEVRRAVLDAATRLFAVRGPSAVPMRDISNDAGVNYGLIHRHFGTKDALVADVVDELAAALADDLRDVDSAEGALDRLGRHAAFVRILGYLCLEDGESGALHRKHPTVKGFLGRLEEMDPDGGEVRMRVAMTTVLALGWMVFGDFIRDAAELDALDDDTVHVELVAGFRRLTGLDSSSALAGRD